MPGKMRECDGCHKVMRSDNLKNHMRKCNGLNQNVNVSNENIRYPFADDSSKMSKSINPKISALIDAIVNEEDEPPEKIQRKDLIENSTDDERQHYPDTLDLTSKVVTDENGDEDDDEDDDDYEDDEIGDEDDDGEDDDNDQLSNEKPRNIKGSNLSKETKIIINKFSQLFQESKRGAKQNRGKLMILLDLLKDCKIFDDKGYDKLYDAIENICNKY
jgi:hypothetical protein